MTIQAKILLQKLWQLGSDWDESVPEDIFSAWSDFERNLNSLNTIKIPMQSTSSMYIDIQLHGFCDASSRAFGCVLYIRTTDAYGVHYSKILCAKSRVAPLKTVTLPRLELCGAVLLARLFKKVYDSLKLPFSKIYLWSDSFIALFWIHSEPSAYKTFVANRIAEIQNLTPLCDWNYTPSEQNPADVISRDINPRHLEHCDLWWRGPEWLCNDDGSWPKKFNKNEDPNDKGFEKKSIKQFSLTTK
ncbi:hypothetical protein ILUMI_22597 [Ignelater luminosus]|uniref:Uncharacterized protein n=1 Tax=Ignelater luminosus TaxID=2038154 RepID=A0A8K0CCH1_IGNLU|nr:hypothetical protein ILUMI_22597 [Ignelater luminosus]